MFDSNCHLFLIYPHLKQSYCQYPTLFYLHTISIHGHVMKIQMALDIINISLRWF